MSKAEDFISPANLWGKPLPVTAAKQADPAKKPTKATRMRKEDYDDSDDNEDIVDDVVGEDDVDAELEEDVVINDELDEIDDSEAYEETDATEDDDDETEYAPEEGDEVEVVATDEEEEDTDSTVESEEEVDDFEPAVAGAKKGKVANMAAKMSGADHIRNEITRRHESGDSLRGVDIVNALAKKKITVSAAQVSQLLKKMGVTAARGGKKPRAAAATVGEDDRSRAAARGKMKKDVDFEEPSRPAPKRAAATSGSATLPMGQLKAAADFLEACGNCYETASDILRSHKELSAMMSR